MTCPGQVVDTLHYIGNVMRKLLFLVVVGAIVYGLGYLTDQDDLKPGSSLWDETTATAVEAAYNNRQSDVQVQGQGTVVRILPDDNDGSRHQRFIVKLDTGLTLLIAHNIDLAPRVADLNTGDTVAFYGEYEWNAKGGVIHWTHVDPAHRHIDGWLKHREKTYQ